MKVDVSMRYLMRLRWRRHGSRSEGRCSFRSQSSSDSSAKRCNGMVVVERKELQEWDLCTMLDVSEGQDVPGNLCW
jgi:hypothetical protein